jgi:Mg/Co/Ni transporter MgtE
MADAFSRRVKRSMPVSALILFALAALALIPALICFAGEGARLHPALADPMAGLAFLVSAVALAGSGAFPLALARLARSDEAGRRD